MHMRKLPPESLSPRLSTTATNKKVISPQSPQNPSISSPLGEISSNGILVTHQITVVSRVKN